MRRLTGWTRLTVGFFVVLVVGFAWGLLAGALEIPFVIALLVAVPAVFVATRWALRA